MRLARMSSALNRSSAVWRFEHYDAIEICDGIIFDSTIMRLPHIASSKTCRKISPSHTIQALFSHSNKLSKRFNLH